MPQFPDLAGQPGWVVVVVVALVLLAGLGGIYLRHRLSVVDSDPTEGAEADKVSPSGELTALSVLENAMKHLASTAEREAQNAEEAEEEARVLSRQLAECNEMRVRLEERIRYLQGRLDACEQFAQMQRRDGT